MTRFLLLALLLAAVAAGVIIYELGKPADSNQDPEVDTSDAIVINEVMAANKSAFPDENGKYEDWIEIYNPNSTPVGRTPGANQGGGNGGFGPGGGGPGGGGFIIEGGPGGGPGGGLGGAPAGTISPSIQSTAQARASQRAQFGNPMLYNAVVEYLKPLVGQ